MIYLPPAARVSLFVVGMYAVAFGWLEAIVVVYIRKMIGLEGSLDMMDAEIQRSILEGFANMRSTGEGGHLSPAFLLVEQARELATIVMLVAIGWLAGRTFRQRAAYFFYAFGIWDITFYAALWVILRWPPSLKTLDILFLIPFEWIAQVWIPMAISLVFIGGAVWSLKGRPRVSRRPK
jgi:hypothetical protein